MRGNLQVKFGGRRASTQPYEYSDYNSSDEQSLTFDSYMIPEDDPELGQSRLLEVDNRVVVPANTHLRMIVTSADVLHSWAVPSLGVKCDAVPGRLNQTSISVQREGVYYGQCSEICGTNHAFMPIVVEAVDRKDYGSRVENQLIPQTGPAKPGLIASPKEKESLGTSIEASIEKFESILKKRGASSSGSNGEISPVSKRRGEILYAGSWNSLAKELRNLGVEVLPNKNSVRAWAAALNKVIKKESTEYSKIFEILNNLEKEGVENTIFKQVLEFVKLQKQNKKK